MTAQAHVVALMLAMLRLSAHTLTLRVAAQTVEVIFIHMYAGDHDHVHEERLQVEQKAVDAEGDDAEKSRLTRALVKAGLDHHWLNHQ